SFSYEVYTIEKTAKVSEATGRPVDEHLPDKFKEPDPVNVIINRVDVTLKGSNPHPEIIVGGRSKDYVNYYKEYTPENGIKNIHYFDTVTYRNIYKNIDFVFIAQKDGSVKYNIVVHPGGLLSDIKMCYTGMEGLTAVAGKLEIKTASGSLEESIPGSYEKGSRKPVLVSYAATGNVVSFNCVYERSGILVVDPIIRQWGTYYGGSGDDIARSVATDDSGNVYVAGYTTSTSGIASSGAYETSFGGYDDAFLVKFNNSGSMQWATYYGGSDIDEGNSVATDGSGNVFLAGEASSTSGIASSGAYQTSGGGNSAAFLVKFNSRGSRIWG